MSAARGVRSGDGAYAVAIAELPRHARRVATVAGSVVVIGGSAGWPARLRQAADEGAAAIVVVAPIAAADAELLAVSVRIPVVVQRPFLRPDSVQDATPTVPGTPLRFVQVESSASRSDFDAVLREGIGWARVLVGSSLDLLTATATRRGLLLQLESAATLLIARRETAPAWIRATALDSVRTEVTINGSIGSPVVVRTDEAGRFRPAARFETPERLALRRAFDALEQDDRPTDLEDLFHDSLLAAQALAQSRAE